jgi:hypothetical protein
LGIKQVGLTPLTLVVDNKIAAARVEAAVGVAGMKDPLLSEGVERRLPRPIRTAQCRAGDPGITKPDEVIRH